MSPLDPRGKIAAAQVAFYTPVAALTAFLIFRYAFRRDAGWFWLFIFAAVRIANAALVIAGQSLSKTNLLVAAYVLEYVGLAPLLLSSIGFIGMAGQHTYSEISRFCRSSKNPWTIRFSGPGIINCWWSVGVADVSLR